MSTKPPLKILVIGTLPPPIGGTSISLQHLVDSLRKRQDIILQVVETNSIRGMGWKGLGKFIKVCSEIIHKSFSSDVITLHVGINALPLIGSVVCLACKVTGKPLIVRRFGGKGLKELHRLSRMVAEIVVKSADIYLVQSKAMLDAARDVGFSHTKWFPTSRPVPKYISSKVSGHEECKRFVFISHLKQTKGILELIQAAERLEFDAHVDIYGPFYDGLDERIFKGCQRTHYRGVLAPNEVLTVLMAYDALVLPTYYPGEGYPGIILESFSVGRPVITTIWKDIPEIVDQSCGILVPPRDPDALCQAMKVMASDSNLYKKLKEGALERHAHFDSEVWVNHFLGFCKELNS